ncbi:MAG: hypothetical protein WEA82_05470 [Idiomarina sp.]
MKLMMAVCISSFWLAGCASFSSSNTLKERAEAIIHQCQTEIERLTGSKLSHGADRAYVYVPASGSYYAMQFTHGAIGTFGPRGDDQGTVWRCSIDEEKIVFLGDFSSPPLINKEHDERNNEEEDNVKEYLYLRFGDGFRFIAVQKLDFNNIDKHNPKFFD